MLNLKYFVTFETFEWVSELRYHKYFRPKVNEIRTLEYELKTTGCKPILKIHFVYLMVTVQIRTNPPLYS